ACDLQRDERTALHDLEKKAFVEFARLGGANAFLDLDACLAQHADTLAANTRIGIADRRDDARDARVNQRLGARRRFSVMRAWLQRDIGGGATRRFTRAGKRLRFGMGAPTLLRPAAPGNHGVSAFP